MITATPYFGMTARPPFAPGRIHAPVRFAALQLTPEETAAWQTLARVRPAQPEQLVYITDPNRDPDDLAAFVVGAALERQGFIRLDSALTTLGSRSVRTRRARLARQVFQRLGQGHVPVGVGGAYPYATPGRRADDQIFLTGSAAVMGPPFLSPAAEVRPDGRALLLERLQGAPPQSLTLTVIAGMGDPARLLQAAPTRQLFQEKVRHVVVMGGVNGRDRAGYVRPDRRAFNNTVDQAAADTLYRGVQELGIPLTVVTMQAAGAAAVAPNFYQGYADADRGKGVGQYLHRVQKEALQKLWRAVTRQINPSLTPDWFYRSFMAPHSRPSKTELDTFRQAAPQANFNRDIWPRLQRLNLYDPLTLLATSPPLAALLFSPQPLHHPHQSPVYLISQNQLKNPPLTKALLSTLGKQALHH